MQIKRTINGVEHTFALSEDELRTAYEEQQHRYDLSDVKVYFDCYEEEDFQSEYGMTRAEAEKKFNDIAYEMRLYMDKYEMGWYDAREAAVSDVLCGRWQSYEFVTDEFVTDEFVTDATPSKE